jgi:opacity protein-like surface antigen
VHQSPNNNFDQFIKGKLENASIEAPAFLWDKIEKKLPPVLPWYSKYKYLLILLSLGLTSSTSIFIYKNFFYKNENSQTIAENNSMIKAENTSAINKAEDSISTENLTEKRSGENTDLKNSVQQNNNENKKVNNNTSVASFYNNVSKNGIVADNNQKVNQTVKEFAKREERLKRFEVKNDEQQNSDLIKKTSEIPASVSVTKTSRKKKHKSGYGSDIPTVEDDLTANADNFNSVINPASGNINSSTPTKETNETTIDNFDITQPIVDPIRNTNTEVLTASVVPLKENVTPLSSREAMRALIEKEKLESLDMASQAAGVTDLNPNRDKVLKNLKQFVGYSINKGFHIGAFIAINNVWLNKKQFSTDENTSGIKPKVMFGKAYGLNIGYDFTDRLGIEMEWQISEQGQKYNVGLLSDNNKHTKDVNLMYTKFPLLIKYKQTFINNYNSKPIAVSFLVGPQFNFLIKEEVKLDGNKINNAPQYNKFEFGLNGGFDFDLYMMRYMYLTIGGRTGFGTSMKKGQPMSFQLGITTQLNFRYAKKLK